MIEEFLLCSIYCFYVLQNAIMLFTWTSCKTSTSSNCIIWPGKAGLGLHDLWDIYNIPISSCGNIWQMAPVYDQQLYDIYISMIKQCQTNDHFLQHFNEKTIETIWFLKWYRKFPWQSVFNISYIPPKINLIRQENISYERRILPVCVCWCMLAR